MLQDFQFFKKMNLEASGGHKWPQTAKISLQNLNLYLYSGFLELGINLYITQIYYTLENRYPMHKITVIQGAS